jgi:hypothetical protein
MTTDEIDEAIDWQGNDVDCGACVHEALLAAGKCELRRTCVHDRYARRIDRFFSGNPDQANRHIDHPYFEVRAIAAKHADVFRLPRLQDDPDEVVRWNATRRLPMRYKLKMRSDPHREVRIRVASYLEDAELVPMMTDTDYYVRLVVARRISPELLGPLMSDPEVEVRRVVASRVAPQMLGAMAHDPDASVRLSVAERMPADALAGLGNDPDWRVRHMVAELSPDMDCLRMLACDDDELVAEMAMMRLTGAQTQSREQVS